MAKKPRTKAGKQRKTAKVMREFAAGTLHSGTKKGPKVKSRKQAIAIAMSESGQARPKKATRRPKRAKRK